MENITVPPSVFGAAEADLRDLRIIDSHGNEVPYTISERAGAETVRWQEAQIDDYGFVAQRYTQVVADAGVPSADYTALDISTPRTNFATTVDVFASDDRREWRTIRRGAPIFDYQADGLGSNTRVRIPSSHSRFYRLHVREAGSAFPIDAVRLAEGSQRLPELTRYGDVRITRSQHGDESILQADAKYAHLPVSFLRIDTATPRFSRAVTLEASDDAVIWSDVDSGVVKRTPMGEKLSFSFDEVQARYWRVRIANGNDAPLRHVRIELWGMPRHVIFASTTGQSLRAVYGNPGAQAPVYDFAATHRASAIAAAVPVALGTAASNTGFVLPQRPWTERNGWVLSTALGLAILTVGALAVRTLVTEGSPGNPDPSKGETSR
jgi:hypothetical protein